MEEGIASEALSLYMRNDFKKCHDVRLMIMMNREGMAWHWTDGLESFRPR